MFQKLHLASRQKLGLYRLLSAVICLALILGVPGAGFAAPEQKGNAAQLEVANASTDDELSRTVMVNLFQWPWASIAAECPNLALAGYNAVQISPPNEHAVYSGDYWDGGQDVDNDDLYYEWMGDDEPDRPYAWWQDYQPVSYKLDKTRRGTLTDFNNMITACHKDGVNIKIIADAVINHAVVVTPNNTPITGSNGTVTYPYWLPELLPAVVTDDATHYYSVDNDYDDNDNDFHFCGTMWPYGGTPPTTSEHDIFNYNDRTEVQMCELVDLADLNTGSENVQKTIANYLLYLSHLGVDGFRVDAGKHMATSDISAIKGLVNTKLAKDTIYYPQQNPWYFFEVIGAAGEPVTEDEYINLGDVTEFSYGQDVTDEFKNGDIKWFNGTDTLGEEWGYLASQSAVVFLNNHDNQRGHGSGISLTYKDGDLYQLANIFSLAWPYGGTVAVMSSYEFDVDPYDWMGPVSATNGTTSPVVCPSSAGPGVYTDGADNRNGWVCEHRWDAITRMVKFRNDTFNPSAATTDSLINNWETIADNQIAFGVNHRGFVVVNNTDTELSSYSPLTGLPDGTYCNVILGELNAQKTGCTGGSITVNDGAASFAVPANSAVAIHVGQKVQPIYPPDSVSIEMGDCKVSTACTFQATVKPNSADPEGDNTYPLTYEWSANGQTSVNHEVASLTDTVSFTWDAEGEYSVSVLVFNNEGEALATTSATVTPAYPLIVTFDLQGVPVSTKVTMISDNPLLNGQKLRNENGTWTMDARVIADSNAVTTLVFYYTRKVGLRSYTETVIHTCSIPSGFHSQWDCTDGWNVPE